MLFVLRVLGDEECEVLADPALPEEFIKLLLKAEVERLKLVQKAFSATSIYGVK